MIENGTNKWNKKKPRRFNNAYFKYKQAERIANFGMQNEDFLRPYHAELKLSYEELFKNRYGQYLRAFV